MESLERLLRIMARLRDPERGCPWDVEQSFETIAPYTLEEAYEVADAIQRGDMDELRDELGDLLLQVVFHAQMASEAGYFDFDDVAKAINDKMIRRHPHVFGEDEARTAEEQTRAWETIKAEERRARQAPDADSGPPSALSGVSLAMPGLPRAVKLTRRAARVGFDWPDAGGVFDKIREELDELEHEYRAGAAHARLEDELGDLLFATANLARHLRVDPESAIRGTNAKFERRFRTMERLMRDSGRHLESVSFEEREAAWNEAKRQEREEQE